MNPPNCLADWMALNEMKKQMQFVLTPKQHTRAMGTRYCPPQNTGKLKVAGNFWSIRSSTEVKATSDTAQSKY